MPGACVRAAVRPRRLAADGSKGCTTRAGIAERVGNTCGELGEELVLVRVQAGKAVLRFGSWCGAERRVERACSVLRGVRAGGCLGEIQLTVTYRCI